MFLITDKERRARERKRELQSPLLPSHFSLNPNGISPPDNLKSPPIRSKFSGEKWLHSFTNKLFAAIFMSSMYYLMRKWRDKIRTTTSLHVLSLPEISAIISFFGIDYVQNLISPQDHETLDPPPYALEKFPLLSNNDEETISAIVAGEIPSYVLESKLGDCRRAAGIRRQAICRLMGRGLEDLPLDGLLRLRFDYASISFPWRQQRAALWPARIAAARRLPNLKGLLALFLRMG